MLAERCLQWLPLRDGVHPPDGDRTHPAHKVQFRRLPDPVLAALREQSEAVLAELAAKDAFAKRVYDSFSAYRDQVRAWSAVSEVPYFQART